MSAAGLSMAPTPTPNAAEREQAATARAFGEAVSDLIFAPAGPLAGLLRVQLADGRVLTFGAPDLATPAAIADGIVRPTLVRILLRDLRAGRPQPFPLALDELRRATVDYFRERATTVTRDNVRSMLADRLPEDQTVVKVERVATPTHRDPR